MSEYTSRWISGDNVLYRGETRLVSIRRENSGLIVTELNTLQAENEILQKNYGVAREAILHHSLKLGDLQAEIEALRQRVAELEAELADHKHDIEVHEEFQKNIRKSIQPYAIKFYDGNGANDGKTIYDHLGDYIGKLEKDALTITAFSLRDFHTGTLIDIPISGLIEHATKQNTRIKELEKKLEGKAKHWITPAELARVYEIVSKIAIESQYPKAVLNKLSEMVFFQTLPRPCLECNAIGEVGRPDHGLVCCDKCSGTGTTSLVCYEDDDSMTVYEYMFDDKQLDVTKS